MVGRGEQPDPFAIPEARLEWKSFVGIHLDTRGRLARSGPPDAEDGMWNPGKRGVQPDMGFLTPAQRFDFELTSLLIRLVHLLNYAKFYLKFKSYN